MPAGRGLGAALGHPAQGRLLTAQHKWNTHVPYKVAVRHLQRSLKREQPARKGRLITVSRFTPSLGILSVHKGSWEEMRTCLPHHQPTTSSPTPKDTNLTSHPLLTRHKFQSLCTPRAMKKVKSSMTTSRPLPLPNLGKRVVSIIICFRLLYQLFPKVKKGITGSLMSVLLGSW